MPKEMPYFIDEFGEGYRIEMRRGPKIQTTLANLEAKNERLLRVALREWMNFTQKQIKHDLAEKYQKSVASELTDWELIQNQGITTIKPAALEIMRTGGNAAYKHLAIMGSFDVLNVQAVKAVNKFCSKLVVDVTKNTKKGINTFVKHGIREGYSMPKIARELRPLVGLTSKQTQAVIHRRQLLQIKRPDLTAAQVDKAVMRYTNKTHRLRMENIARTETANAQNIGYCQGLEQVGVEEAELSNGSNPCDDCIALNRTRYPIAEAVGIITVHPRCTCAMLPVIDEKVVSHPLRAPPAGLPEVKPVTAPPKPVVSPKPAGKLFEAENTGKAEANTCRILGIDPFKPTQRARVSLKGIDAEAANHVNRGLYNFKQKFPELHLDKIKVSKLKDAVAEVSLNYKTGKTTLMLDSTSFKNHKALTRTLERNGATNYLIGNSIEDTIAHECGHAMIDSHLFRKYGVKSAFEIRKLERIKFNQVGLSRYATSDGIEGLAETFSKYIKVGNVSGISTAKKLDVKELLKTYAGVEL